MILIDCGNLYFSVFLLIRVPQVNRTGKEDNTDPIKPVFVAEFPQVVRDEQAALLRKRVPGKNSWIHHCIALTCVLVNSFNSES